MLDADARYHAIILPYHPAGDLLSKMQRPSRAFTGSAQDAHSLALGIASGLAYLHSRGIIHNDLKPSNILLTEIDHPVICDFGHATRHPGAQRSGTHAYIPPETWDGQPRSYPSDVYAFALILLWLVQVTPLPDFYTHSDIIKALGDDPEHVLRSDSCLGFVNSARQEAKKALLSATGIRRRHSPFPHLAMHIS
jgi:serine/threonine protein kinase